jgi:hypothetical protein
MQTAGNRELGSKGIGRGAGFLGMGHSRFPDSNWIALFRVAPERRS